jgi:hypothetical protein
MAQQLKVTSAFEFSVLTLMVPRLHFRKYRNTLAVCRSPHETSPFYVNVLVHEKPAIPGIIAECIRYLTKKTTSKTQSLIPNSAVKEDENGADTRRHKGF